MQLFPHRTQIDNELGLLGPPHPGEILRVDVLPRLKLTQAALARHLGISRSVLSGILNEKRRVSSGVARKLAEALGPSALYWLVVQAHHDAWILMRDAPPVRARVPYLPISARPLPPVAPVVNPVIQAPQLVGPSATPPRAPVRRRASGRAAGTFV